MAIQKSQRPSLAPVITRLQYPLAPLHPQPDGDPHPSFPRTLLHYHLLTEDQLDSIALYYHQVVSPTKPTSVWIDEYPATMNWDTGYLAHVGHLHGAQARISTKKRKVGRFIGLRGCDTPLEEVEDFSRWRSRRDEVGIKGGDEFGYWGRRGFRRW